MKVLVIGAHPDDETFGMGGTLARHVKEKADVFVLIVADGVTARDGNPEKQHEALRTAMGIYGVGLWKHLKYPDQKMDTIPLLHLVREIEEIISGFAPDVIYTHAREDIGQDHRRVHEATMIAARPLMGAGIKSVISYPSPSSTWWSEMPFTANHYVNITRSSGIKREVLEKAYPHEVPDGAHPRSYAGIGERESWLGQLIGIAGKAEEFCIVRQIR